MTVKNLGGAPKGNKNAAGHGAPRQNKNAVKHGLYEKIDLDKMSEDEKTVYLSLLEASGYHKELAELRYKYIRVMKSSDSNKNHLKCQIIKRMKRVLMKDCYLHTEYENRKLKKMEVSNAIQELLKFI